MTDTNIDNHLKITHNIYSLPNMKLLDNQGKTLNIFHLQIIKFINNNLTITRAIFSINLLTMKFKVLNTIENTGMKGMDLYRLTLNLDKIDILSPQKLLLLNKNIDRL